MQINRIGNLFKKKWFGFGMLNSISDSFNFLWVFLIGVLASSATGRASKDFNLLSANTLVLFIMLTISAVIFIFIRKSRLVFDRSQLLIIVSGFFVGISNSLLLLVYKELGGQMSSLMSISLPLFMGLSNWIFLNKKLSFLGWSFLIIGISSLVGMSLLNSIRFSASYVGYIYMAIAISFWIIQGLIVQQFVGKNHVNLVDSLFLRLIGQSISIIGIYNPVMCAYKGIDISDLFVSIGESFTQVKYIIVLVFMSTAYLLGIVGYHGAASNGNATLALMMYSLYAIWTPIIISVIPQITNTLNMSYYIFAPITFISIFSFILVESRYH